MRRGISFENWEENTEIVISPQSEDRDSGRGTVQYGNYWNVHWEKVYTAFKEFSRTEVTHDVSKSFAKIMKLKPHWSGLMMILMWYPLYAKYCSVCFTYTKDQYYFSHRHWVCVLNRLQCMRESSGIPRFVNACYLNPGREQILIGRVACEMERKLERGQSRQPAGQQPARFRFSSHIQRIGRETYLFYI